MRLKTFGGLTITNGGEAVAELRLQRRQLALLAVLAAEGAAGVTRERLLGLFWPDTEPGKARHALDQLLYGIRRALGAEVVISGPGSLQLDAVALPSDAAEFLTALDGGDLETGVAVYTGPFLDGVYVADAPEFDRWAEGRRTRFTNAFVRALTRLADRASTAGDHALAVQYLRRAAASDPLSGSVAQALILALTQGVNTAAALEAGRVHVTMVRQELDAEPDPAVSALIAQLKANGTSVQPVPPSAPAPVVAPSSLGGPPPAAKESPHPTELTRAVPRGGRLGIATLALAAVALLGILLVRTTRGDRRASGVTLRDRNQVTTSGRIREPALSADGKSLAYVMTTCGTTGCTNAVEIQEVGGSVTQRILEGAKSIYYILWSPDGRNLLVAGTLAGPDRGVNSLYLLSVLGGTPQLLCQCAGTFFAGGDSLLLDPDQAGGQVWWLYVAGLDGLARDSIRVDGPAADLSFVLNVPGTSWFVLSMLHTSPAHAARHELRVIDRTGREGDRFISPLTDIFHVSVDAVWLSLPQVDYFNLIRVPLDAKTGRFSAVRDTVYTGAFTGFDVTADGSQLVLDEGTSDYDGWALEFQAALRGAFALEKRLVHSSSPVILYLSPDGGRILIAREQSHAVGFKFRYSIIPFEGGAEFPLAVRGNPVSADWYDATTIVLGEVESGRLRRELVDVRSGARREAFAGADSLSLCCQARPLPGGGWAWIPPDWQSVRVKRPEDAAPHIFPKPAWFHDLFTIAVSSDGQRLLYIGWNATVDSMRVDLLSLRDGSTVPWLTVPIAQGAAQPSWLADGSILLGINTAPDTRTFYRLRAPGRVETLGTIPRPVWVVNVSLDLKRAAVTTRDYHGDAWMYRVERR